MDMETIKFINAQEGKNRSSIEEYKGYFTSVHLLVHYISVQSSNAWI